MGQLKPCPETAVFYICRQNLGIFIFVAWVNRKETPNMGEGGRRVGERALELNLTFLLAPKNAKALMLQRFVCTKKLLFQNAITCGMIKPTVLEIALNSINQSHYFGARKKEKKKKMYIPVKKG